MGLQDPCEVSQHHVLTIPLPWLSAPPWLSWMEDWFAIIHKKDFHSDIQMPKKLHSKIATEVEYSSKVSHIFSGEDSSGNQFWAVANSQTSEEVATLVAEVFGCCLYRYRLQNIIVITTCLSKVFHKKKS